MLERYTIKRNTEKYQKQLNFLSRFNWKFCVCLQTIFIVDLSIYYIACSESSFHVVALPSLLFIFEHVISKICIEKNRSEKQLNAIQESSLLKPHCDYFKFLTAILYLNTFIRKQFIFDSSKNISYKSIHLLFSFTEVVYWKHRILN